MISKWTTHINIQYSDFLTTNSFYLPKQHRVTGLCNGDAMYFLWDKNWILVCYLGGLRASKD
jgi:hypothetical protein